MEEEAKKILQELNAMSDAGYVSAFWFAVIYAGLKEKDKAFEWLEKAYEEHYEVLIFLGTIPFFDSIRDNPRYEGLCEKIGLADFI